MLVGTKEDGVEGTREEVSLASYPHFRPVLVQRIQLGFSSPHFTLRILGAISGWCDNQAETYLHVLQPERDFAAPIRRLDPGSLLILQILKSEYLYIS